MKQETKNIDAFKDLFLAYSSMAELPDKSEAIIKSMEALKRQILSNLDKASKSINPDDLGEAEFDIDDIGGLKTPKPTEKEQRRRELGHFRALKFSELIETHSGGILLQVLLTELGVKKIVFAEETGVGVNNLGYLSSMIKGTAPISKRNAERFAKWFEERGVYVPIIKLIQNKNGG
ncbi:MAG: hypothetical protein ACKOW9_03150 [Candidatus Paceibacterota bacterium]